MAVGRSLLTAAALATTLTVGGGLGCEPEATGPTPGALVLGTVDTAEFCDRDEVVSVQISATWLGCLAERPDCDEPTEVVSEGDRYSCPATDPQRLLGVELTRPGSYRFEAVATLTTGPPLHHCFVDPQTDEPTVELPRAAVEDGQTVRLPHHEPCPL